MFAFILEQVGGKEFRCTSRWFTFTRSTVSSSMEMEE